jgi:hypothetical protein
LCSCVLRFRKTGARAHRHYSVCLANSCQFKACDLTEDVSLKTPDGACQTCVLHSLLVATCRPNIRHNCRCTTIKMRMALVYLGELALWGLGLPRSELAVVIYRHVVGAEARDLLGERNAARRHQTLHSHVKTMSCRLTRTVLQHTHAISQREGATQP